MIKKLLMIVLVSFVFQIILTTCTPCVPQVNSYDITKILVNCIDYNLNDLSVNSVINIDSVEVKCVLYGKEYKRDKQAYFNFGSSIYAKTTCHDYEDVNEGLVNKIKAIEVSCDKEIWGIKAGMPLDTTMYVIKSYAFWGDTLSNSTLINNYNDYGIAIDKYGKGYGNSIFHISFSQGFNKEAFASFKITIKFNNGEEVQGMTKPINIYKMPDHQ